MKIMKVDENHRQTETTGDGANHRAIDAVNRRAIDAVSRLTIVAVNRRAVVAVNRQTYDVGRRMNAGVIRQMDADVNNRGGGTSRRIGKTAANVRRQTIAKEVNDNGIKFGVGRPAAAEVNHEGSRRN